LTKHFLPIPSDDPENCSNYRRWAFNTVLTPEEIDKERGGLEEYRLGLGAEKKNDGSLSF
jgi:zinc protease